MSHTRGGGEFFTLQLVTTVHFHTHLTGCDCPVGSVHVVRLIRVQISAAEISTHV